MRIAELSRDSGVPVPTIKYYVREGLLPPGELTSPNQAQYDDSHLRRLKLIRALAEVGRLPVAAIGDLLAAAGSPATSLHDALGKAQYATTPRFCYQASDASGKAAVRQADELIRNRGWQVRPDSPARELLTGVRTSTASSRASSSAPFSATPFSPRCGVSLKRMPPRALPSAAACHKRVLRGAAR